MNMLKQLVISNLPFDWLMSIFLFDVLYDNNNNHCPSFLFFLHSRATSICTRRTPFLCPLSVRTFFRLLFVNRIVIFLCVCVFMLRAVRVHLINKLYCFFAFCNIINVLRSNKAGGGRLVRLIPEYRKYYVRF